MKVQARHSLMPLRDVVVFPFMVVPLFVGRESSIKALEYALANDKKILLVTQKDAATENPIPKDMHDVGVLASILQMMRLPDGTVKVLVEGVKRAKISNFDEKSGFFLADCEPLDDLIEDLEENKLQVLMHESKLEFGKYAKSNSKISADIVDSLNDGESPDRLAYSIASNLQIKTSDKQKFLVQKSLSDLFEQLLVSLVTEVDIKLTEKRVRSRVKKQMEQSQREYYLNEKMKAIQKELNGNDAEAVDEFSEIADKIKKSGMPKEGQEKLNKELGKLKMMSPTSSEANVIRTYIETVLDVPWKKRSKVRSDIKMAEDILNQDHYGLEEVKERIIEYLAVQQRVKHMKSPILCLVGPPGVGKTSLGQSIARATKRKFVRMSLGGVRDEAEIRGHRRTYIGSMPGRIIQKMTKAKVKNPLFLLDEIDKMSMDFRGDPASALLEVLDPEQNNSFNDHYLELDYDLSDVMFVATSNSMNMPGPLVDRMEIIRIPGYTENEKLHIAKEHLIAKQLKNHGLAEAEIILRDKAILDIIRYYTREAGVRGLDKDIAKIMRKVVKDLSFDKRKKKVTVNSKNLEHYLGVRKFRYGTADKKDQIGQVTGLAWTPVGGDLLTIEAAIMPGKGKFSVTGQLGDVMKESIQAAMSVVRGRADALGIARNFSEKQDIHIHVPEGAIPKDGPSAGVGMCTALVSVLTGIAVRCDVAMTGEITLRGEVLPIGGLKEKLLAAHRGGIKTVLIPYENEKDLKEIPAVVLKDVVVKPVRWIEEVLDIALVSSPEPLVLDKGRSRIKRPIKSRRLRAH